VRDHKHLVTDGRVEQFAPAEEGPVTVGGDEFDGGHARPSVGRSAQTRAQQHVAQQVSGERHAALGAGALT
jgi:hypothetical protein